eukprot:8704229-Pyramimonas_sp.AAC.1
MVRLDLPPIFSARLGARVPCGARGCPGVRFGGPVRARGPGRARGCPGVHRGVSPIAQQPYSPIAL